MGTLPVGVIRFYWDWRLGSRHGETRFRSHWRKVDDKMLTTTTTTTMVWWNYGEHLPAALLLCCHVLHTVPSQQLQQLKRHRTCVSALPTPPGSGSAGSSSASGRFGPAGVNSSGSCAVSLPAGRLRRRGRKRKERDKKKCALDYIGVKQRQKQRPLQNG